MMGHTGALLGRWFGRANVQVAIDLHGINGDDFASEPLGEQHGDVRLAYGRRSGQQERARRADSGWRMVSGLGCHRYALSSIRYPRLASGRGRSQSRITPAARMAMLTSWAGVTQPPR